jgi:hypothetical protein
MMAVLALACVSMAQIRSGSGNLQTARTPDFRSVGSMSVQEPARGIVAQSAFGPVKSVRQFTPMGEALPATTAAYSGIVVRQIVDQSGSASGRKVVVTRGNFKNGFERFLDMWK